MALTNAIDEMLNSGADAYKNIYDVHIKFPSETISNTDELAGTKLAVKEGTAKFVSVRCEGFNIPKYESGMSDRKYKGVTVSVPKPEENFTREFELTFRMDADYTLYGDFCKWQSKVVGPNGNVSNWLSHLGEVEVTAVTGDYIAATSRSGIDEQIKSKEDAINAETSDTKKAELQEELEELKNAKKDDNSIYESGKYAINYEDVSDGVGISTKKTWTFDKVWVTSVTRPEFSNTDTGEIVYTVKFQFYNETIA